ncbi:MAG: hypothetical protein KTR21_07220, partial [Rhodobacteraceae bacterium]|nr:hypothetical protein [Paracoccaceae bacterium]
TGIDAESFRDRAPARAPRVEAAPAPRTAREVEPFAPPASSSSPAPSASEPVSGPAPVTRGGPSAPQASSYPAPVTSIGGSAAAALSEPAPVASAAPAQPANLFAQAQAPAFPAPLASAPHAAEPARPSRVRTPAAKFVDPIADQELSTHDLSSMSASQGGGGDGFAERGFGDADEFESPRGLRDPAVAPAEPLRVQETVRDFGASQRDLVQKMTRNGVHYDVAATAEPVRAQEDFRVQIPSFLRRQAN